MVSVLDELEAWAPVLEADPEVSAKLRELEAVAVQKNGITDNVVPAGSRRTPSRGPSL